MKSYFFKNSELTDAETSLAFKARRRLIRLPLVLFSICMILNLSVDALRTFPEGYEVFQGIVMFAFGLLTIYTYRCPRCGDPPKSRQAFTSGVLIFPRKCSKCAAPLMPDHRWAQD
jgi:hypothetical protein